MKLLLILFATVFAVSYGSPIPEIQEGSSNPFGELIGSEISSEADVDETTTVRAVYDSDEDAGLVFSGDISAEEGSGNAQQHLLKKREMKRPWCQWCG
ncbi:uncharacterized protein CELE_W02D9.7 [Caenorhabditis elegans]|uniref:Secreted protein n=1 Tax=Caenorhabditis elegans TaxID=6239 RepID=Q9XVG9_CAEEL|nr:Secreted protein [Caenorhabditis elegans]CAB03464.1 Secreted protein [Caenorhabditis elegans]|eukprot:NP_493183.1 Uncharacterized protein CELE_W02D9.7 [Caenorhabditis elegans]